MKHLSLLFIAGLLVVSSAFAPAADPVYPELAATFKALKKVIPSAVAAKKYSAASSNWVL
ncbi:hypothetical protein HK413_10200 [Mucilaginibacter sp. S1162]|uniref:Uncharacterized protein n=1 Tax=Mucilaginibacter humi TaxID=2732510 RepID=A0ABX1W2F4_9SPHI|nr:hypothetical protein [Mucilaginibacter humi]NNU34407.1 hypothetical protein [Mucilaginibacter humi]